MVSPALQHWRSKSPVSSLRQNNNRMLCFLQSPPWSFGAWCSVTPWNHYCGLQSRWCLTQWKRHRIWRSSLHISSFLFTSLHIRFLFSCYMFAYLLFFLLLICILPLYLIFASLHICSFLFSCLHVFVISLRKCDLESTVGRSGPANQVSSRLASNTFRKQGHTVTIKES